MAGETVSMLGTWMQQFAQGWVVAGLTSNAITLGLVNFASGVPMLLLTMYGGVMADRFDKRRIMLIALAVQAVLAVAVGLLVGGNRLEVWHIVVAGMALGTVVAFEMPAAAALVPELVEREELRAAISVDRSVFHATRLAGPALGGVLIGRLGMESAFYANALSYAALAAALIYIRPRQIEKPPNEDGQRAGMKEGLAYVRRDRPTFSVIVLLATITLFVSPFFMILMPLYSQKVLHVGPEQHGWLMASSGVGAFTGSLLLFAIPTARRRGFMFAGIATIALAMGGLAAAQNLVAAIAAMIVLTLGTSTLYGLANTIVQERAPDYIRGRVSAIAGMSFLGVLPFSGLVVSQFSDFVGMRTAMGTAAVCFGVIAGSLFFNSREAMRGEVKAVEV
jgi:MFS family permease